MNYEDRQVMNNQIEIIKNSTDRQVLIGSIEGLWPADSDYPENASIGREFLEEARREVNRDNWRNEPIDVLQIYAEKCIRKDWEGV